jgi:hypothetical protein
MPRSGYTNVYSAQPERAELFTALARLTHRDASKHGDRVAIIDDSLRHYASHLRGQRFAALKWALRAFIDSVDFAPAVIKSTQAAANGEYYAAELFDDGTYRVLWSAKIGNCHKSPGAIIKVPALTDDADIMSTEELSALSRDELASEMWDALEGMLIDK